MGRFATLDAREFVGKGQCLAVVRHSPIGLWSRFAPRFRVGHGPNRYPAGNYTTVDLNKAFDNPPGGARPTVVLGILDCRFSWRLWGRRGSVSSLVGPIG